MKKFLFYHKEEIVIALSLFLVLINTSSPFFDRYIIPSYIVNYTSGFGDRKLVGSLFCLITNNFVTAKLFVLGVLSIYLLTIIALSLLLAKLLRNVEQKNKSVYLSVLFLLLLYVISPASIGYLFVPHNYGRLDVYLLLIACVFISIFCGREKRDVTYFISILLVSILGLLIHSIFIFSFYALFLALFVYDIIRSKNDKRLIIGYALNVIIVYSLFCYISFVSSMNLSMAQEINVIRNMTNMRIDEQPIFYMHYANLNDHLSGWIIPNLYHLMMGLLMTLILLIPFFFLFIWIFKQAIAYVPRNCSYMYYSICLCFMTTVPIYFVTTDHPRWLGMLFSCLFALVFVLVFLNDKGIIHALSRLSDVIKQKPLLSFLLVIYIYALPYFETMNYPKPVETILNMFGIGIVCP